MIFTPRTAVKFPFIRRSDTRSAHARLRNCEQENVVSLASALRNLAMMTSLLASSRVSILSTCLNLSITHNTLRGAETPSKHPAYFRYTVNHRYLDALLFCCTYSGRASAYDPSACAVTVLTEVSIKLIGYRSFFSRRPCFFRRKQLRITTVILFDYFLVIHKLQFSIHNFLEWTFEILGNSSSLLD